MSQTLTMAVSLIVKAYLQRDDEGQSEIRRFPLRVELGQDRFKALQRKLVEVFPGLKMGCFTLLWKDEDGDLVKFCSQDELQQALNMVNDGVLRIYISANSTSEEAAEVVENPEGDGKEPPTCTFQCPLSQPSCGRIQMHPSWHMHGMHFKKMKKMVKKEAKKRKKLRKKMARIQHREFMILRSQVPHAFRSWVCKYIRVWFTDRHLAAAKLDDIPEGAPPNFKEWLVAYLEKINKKQEGRAVGYTDTLEQDIDLPVSPEGLPASYYKWLCLYVERNFAHYTQDSSDIDTSSSDDSLGSSVWQERGHSPCHWHMHHFRNDHCLIKGKHGWSASKSADEEILKMHATGHWESCTEKARNNTSQTHPFLPSFGHHGMHMPSFQGSQFGFPPPTPPPMMYPEMVPTPPPPPMIYPHIAPPLHPPPPYWDQVFGLDNGYHFHGGKGGCDQDQSQRSVSQLTEAMKKM